MQGCGQQMAAALPAESTAWQAARKVASQASMADHQQHRFSEASLLVAAAWEGAAGQYNA